MHMAEAILFVIESSDGPIKFNLTYSSEFSLRMTWKS